MTTTAERLQELSGLSGVSAAEHLKAIAGAAGVAGVLLVAYSGLSTGTATEHLLVDTSVEPPVGLYVPPHHVPQLDVAEVVNAKGRTYGESVATATGVTVILASAEASSGESAVARGKVTADKKRMAMLDEELLFL